MGDERGGAAGLRAGGGALAGAAGLALIAKLAVALPRRILKGR